jgi:hypothetical protein
MIYISDPAQEQLTKLMESDGKDPSATYVRVGV